ncbi:MAG TPA: hypothetical protein VFX51_26305 [Solirubrobacteraceae bacterium]|nr:hypothetical protein [Solirubrobacteraceae bacterium]
MDATLRDAIFAIGPHIRSTISPLVAGRLGLPPEPAIEAVIKAPRAWRRLSEERDDEQPQERHHDNHHANRREHLQPHHQPKPESANAESRQTEQEGDAPRHKALRTRTQHGDLYAPRAGGRKGRCGPASLPIPKCV